MPAGQASVAKDPENLAVSWCVCPRSLTGSGKICEDLGRSGDAMVGWMVGWAAVSPVALKDNFDVMFEIVPV
jgi:hypothetical protein